MFWSRAEFEDLVRLQPTLGIALMQFNLRRCMELEERLGILASLHLEERLMLVLLEIASQVGKAAPDGRLRVYGVPQNTLARFVGTSREAASAEMNHLRRLNMVRYSRSFMDIDCVLIREALQELLHAHPSRMPGASS
jgi:CRP-like cAMP-binding protein